MAHIYQKGKMIRNQTFRLLRIIGLVFLSSGISAKHDFKDYSEKAKDHFLLLQDIYSKYPLADKNKLMEIILVEEKRWYDIETDYKQTTGRNRSRVLLLIRENYLNLLDYVQKACLQLKRYSDDILIDFAERRQRKNLNRKEIDIYENSFNVANREIHRAKKAFLNHQFNYSAKLYDRAVVILANTYKKLNWVVPPTYKNVQTVKVSSNSPEK